MGGDSRLMIVNDGSKDKTYQIMRDLREKYPRLLTINKKGHLVTFHKVKGHSDHPENNRCDALARAAIQQYLSRNPDLGDPNQLNIQHS